MEIVKKIIGIASSKGIVIPHDIRIKGKNPEIGDSIVIDIKEIIKKNK